MLDRIGPGWSGIVGVDPYWPCRSRLLRLLGVDHQQTARYLAIQRFFKSSCSCWSSGSSFTVRQLGSPYCRRLSSPVQSILVHFCQWVLPLKYWAHNTRFLAMEAGEQLSDGRKIDNTRLPGTKLRQHESLRSNP